MGQRTLKPDDLAKLIDVVKSMKSGDFLGVKKVGGRWSVRTRFKRRTTQPIDKPTSNRQD